MSKSMQKKVVPSTRKSAVKKGLAITSTQNGVGKFAQKGASVGAAQSVLFRGVGLSDLVAHRASWLAGYIYVGNGTLGATDGVYYRDVTTNVTIVPSAPIGAGDANVGQTYMQDIEKHYSRKVYRRLMAHIIPLQTSTSNSMVAYIAPTRGPTGLLSSATHTDTTVANVISMGGVTEAASWQASTIDITPYIAGGSGAQQNEFQMTNLVAEGAIIGNDTWGTDLVPAMLTVAGNNATSGLRGTNTHLVVIEQIADYLDFLGGFSPIDVLEAPRRSLVKMA